MNPPSRLETYLVLLIEVIIFILSYRFQESYLRFAAGVSQGRRNISEYSIWGTGRQEPGKKLISLNELIIGKDESGVEERQLFF